MRSLKNHESTGMCMHNMLIKYEMLTEYEHLTLHINFYEKLSNVDIEKVNKDFNYFKK